MAAAKKPRRKGSRGRGGAPRAAAGNTATSAVGRGSPAAETRAADALDAALRRLVQIEGSPEAAATALREQGKDALSTLTGVGLSRWLKAPRGASSAIGDDLLRFELMVEVYRRLAHWDRNPELQQRREKRLAGRKERAVELAVMLSGLVAEVNEANALMGLRTSAVAVVADRIGVSPGALRGWIKRLRVSGQSLSAVDAWASQRADMFGKSARAAMRRLMAKLRQPGPGVEAIPGRQPEHFENMKLEPFRSSVGMIDSELRSGYYWAKHIGAFLTDLVLARMVLFAKGGRSKLPRGLNSRAWRQWMIIMVCAEYNPAGAEPPEITGSDKGRVRELSEDDEDAEAAERTVINQGRSSGKWSTLDRAVASFVVAIREWMMQPLLIFVQGVKVENWRDKTPRQASDWRDRDLATYNRERRNKRRAESAKKKAARRRKERGL